MIINSNIIKMIFNRNNYIKNSRQVTTLSDIGIKNINTIYHNLSNSDIYNHEVKNNEGIIAKTTYGDVFSIDTGKFTGRSVGKQKPFPGKIESYTAHVFWRLGTPRGGYGAGPGLAVAWGLPSQG